MRRKLLYLVNPISGTRGKAPLKDLIRKKTAPAALDFEIAETRLNGDYSDLPRRISAEKITDVVVCGGDGSVSTVSSHLLGIDVAVGIVPLGSGNGLALAAGISSSASRALDIIIRGRSSFVDGFMVNDKFSCMMCGLGNDAQVAHDFASKKVRGLKTYLRISARNYFTSKPYSFNIVTNGQNADIDAFFITIANSNQFGNNVTIAPRASLSDGLLDVIIVKKMHKLILPFELLRQITGINPLSELHNYRNNRNIIYFQVREATIRNNGNAPMHIDGEPYPACDEVRVKVLPNAFRLLQPFD